MHIVKGLADRDHYVRECRTPQTKPNQTMVGGGSQSFQEKQNFLDIRKKDKIKKDKNWEINGT